LIGAFGIGALTTHFSPSTPRFVGDLKFFYPIFSVEGFPSVSLYMNAGEGLIEIIADRREAWTVPQLAKLLALSKGEIYEQVKAGKLPAFKIGTSIRLCPKLTAQWLHSRLTTS
jgi:excisionase family DNA binding protein